MKLLGGKNMIAWTNVFQLIFEVMGSVAAVIGVIVTDKIYTDGIKRTRENTLRKFEIEIATDFVIPYMKLMDELNGLFEKAGGIDKTKVADVCDAIKKYRLKCDFSLWQTARVEFWNTVSSSKSKSCAENSEEKMQIGESIAKVEKFIYEARKIGNGVKNVLKNIELYLKNNEMSCDQILEDYFKSSKNDISGKLENPLDYVKEGIDSLNEMPKYIQNLPDELEVKEYCYWVEKRFFFARISTYGL